MGRRRQSNLRMGQRSRTGKTSRHLATLWQPRHSQKPLNPKGCRAVAIQNPPPPNSGTPRASTKPSANQPPQLPEAAQKDPRRQARQRGVHRASRPSGPKRPRSLYTAHDITLLEGLHALGGSPPFPRGRSGSPAFPPATRDLLGRSSSGSPTTTPPSITPAWTAEPPTNTKPNTDRPTAGTVLGAQIVGIAFTGLVHLAIMLPLILVDPLV